MAEWRSSGRLFWGVMEWHNGGVGKWERGSGALGYTICYLIMYHCGLLFPASGSEGFYFSGLGDLGGG